MLIAALAPEDRIRLGTFGREIALSPFFTNDKQLLNDIANEELWPIGHSFPWPAVHAAMESIATEGGRKVIILLGYNPVADVRDDGRLRSQFLTGFRGDFGQVRSLALRDDFVVYVVGTHPSVGLSPQGVMLARDSGGGHVVPPRGTLPEAMSQVVEELRHQYLLGFRPQLLDGKEHDLSVRTSRGEVVRARRKFIARTAK
jgi:hypothetical protein